MTCTLLVMVGGWGQVRAAELPPHIESLERAAISVDRLDSILEYALLLGNGDINGLLYQESTGELVLRITKNDVWDARVLTEKDPPLPTLTRLKELGSRPWPDRQRGKTLILPEGVTYTGDDSYHSDAFPCPRACAVLRLGSRDENQSKRGGNDKSDSSAPEQSRRSATLDIRRAVARIHGAGTRTVRALADSNVFLIECDEAASLVPITPGDIPAAQTSETAGVTWVFQEIPGDLDWPGMSFAVALAQNARRKAVAVVTSREAKDPVAAAVALSRDALQLDTAHLVTEHEKQWDRYWSRSGIQLDDAFLSDAWYRNLYLLRCVTKPGVIAPGLFASLTTARPQWHGDYHTNYNLQQTFWGSLAANQPTLIQPYDELIRSYIPRGEWLARNVFDCGGVYYPHVLFAYEPPDPATCKSRNGRQYLHHVWGMTIGVTGFTVQPLWWHYKYAPDRKLLADTVYPPLRGAAEFYADFAEQCAIGDDGRVVLGPSVSPEHHGWTEYFALNRNCTFDIAMVRYTLEAAIEAAGTLDTDETFVTRWRKTLKRLPNYPTTESDAPVVVDVLGAQPMNYNIAVPVTPVFPGDVVTWWSEPTIKQLFERTIAGCRWNGNNSMIILAVARARLSMPDTDQWLTTELRKRMRPNQLITLNRLGHHNNKHGHYTEQFAATMAVSELLVQSVGDKIRVFPAWPRDKDAAITNLRAQGGFLVSAQQKSGVVTKLEITSTVGGTLRLLDPWTGQLVEHSTTPNQKLVFKPR